MPGERSEADRVRLRLRELGQQRVQHAAAGEELADEIKKTVREAQSSSVPLAEVARLLGLDRSTLYRTYLDGGEG
jgi:transcriptional regulator of acetoin/glycerol metabolism